MAAKVLREIIDLFSRINKEQSRDEISPGIEEQGKTNWLWVPSKNPLLQARARGPRARAKIAEAFNQAIKSWRNHGLNRPRGRDTHDAADRLPITEETS